MKKEVKIHPKKPLVSVIIPTYNRANFLKEALDSVFQQTYKNYEVIVVDDGSIDHTAQIVTKFPLKYIKKPFNKGVASARNRGIQEAQGELIAFLDSDDLWLPKKLEKQVLFFKKNPQAVAVQPEEIWIRKGKRVNPKRKHAKQGGWIFHRCVEMCVVSPSGIMLKKNVLKEIGPFDESFSVCEDYEMWLRLSARYPIYLMPEPLLIKRGGHKDQLSKRPGLDWFRTLALYKIYQNISLEPFMRLLVLQQAHKKGIIYLKGALKRGKLKEVWEILRLLNKMDSAPGLSSFKALKN